MNNTLSSRKLWILSLFALVILSMTIFTGCGDDDETILGPSFGPDVNWTMERGDINTDILHAVFFTSNTNGWAVGDNGSIIKYVDSVCVTDNNGVIDSNFTDCRWTPLNSGTDVSIRDLYFVDNNIGWAVGSRGHILNTTDAGANWDIDTTFKICYFGSEPIRVNLNGVYFSDANSGWAVGENGSIFKYATDSACVDTQVFKDTIINFTIDSIYLFLDSFFFFDTTEFYNIDTTFYYVDSVINSGSDPVYDTSWFYIDSIFHAETTVTITIDTIFNGVFDTTNLIIDSIFDSTSYYPDSLIIDTSYDTVVLVIDTTVNDTVIYEIPDSTINIIDTEIVTQQSGWFIILTEVIQNLWDVTFVEGTYGWVVGDLGTIAYTGNGGISWEDQETGLSVSLRAVTFIDANNGWVVGHSGTILHTSNGGQSWHKQFTGSGLTNHFVSVSFADALNGWVVNTQGDIYRTVDGGFSWYLDRQGFNLGFNSIFFLDGTTGWMVGYDGNIMHAVKK